MKFVNRQKELAQLNKLWREKEAQLIIVYGKRRVGKTELIKQFMKKHSGIYYLADKRTHKEQLLEFGRVVGNYFDDMILTSRGFESWLEAFEYLKKKSKNKKFIVALDEYPYLAEAQSDTTSLFQKGWDEYLKDSKAYMILCGSSIAMMESEILSYKAPLYGRVTGRMLIEPLSVKDSMLFFPKKPFTEFLSLFSITGGMPAYLQAFSKYNSVKEAVEELCFNRNGLFHNEVTFMLKQELRTPNLYFAILKAIAWGNTKVSNIANDSGLEVPLVNKYLKTLERLQLVKREVPITEDKPYKSKKGIYVLRENFVRFWFQYIYAFSSDLEIGNLSEAKKKFKESSHILEAIAYEDIARSHLWELQKQLFTFDKVGRYWDSTVEIDGIGINSKEKKIAFMEAKYSSEKVSKTVLNKLRMKAQMVNWHEGKREEYFVLFSKSGFEDDLIQESRKDSKVILIQKLKLLI